jgi:hypothetical protein
MNETPPLPDQEAALSAPEQERGLPVPIEDWAKQNNHTSLLRHIESSHDTDANVGVFRENLVYDPDLKVITLVVSPSKNIHQGHSFEGIGIMLGGIPKVFVDVVSGALVFTEIPSTSVPVHKRGSYENPEMIIQCDTVVKIVSRFDEEMVQEEAKKYVITQVSQGGKICVVMRDEIWVGAERGVGLLAKRRENILNREKSTAASNILPQEI